VPGRRIPFGFIHGPVGQKIGLEIGFPRYRDEAHIRETRKE
jgi:hypothetical protein